MDFVLLLLGITTASLETLSAEQKSMAPISAGYYQPLYLEPVPKDKTQKEIFELRRGEKVKVQKFLMDRYAVTRKEFEDFVKSHSEWSRSQIKKLYADASYLRDWASDTDAGFEQKPNSPVRYVSWFAARAYCKSQGKRLPTVAEWEYAAAAFRNIRHLPQKILDWYSRPNSKVMDEVGTTFANDFGVYDLHGLIWEWVEDFNSSLVTGESRGDSSLDRSAFCGSGGLNASNFKDYGAFMRFGFRSSLNGSFALANLGFRCVKN